MEFRLLGSLELFDGLRPVPLGGARQRAVLALLLLHPNELVASDRLLEELWHGQAGPRAQNALQAAVSRLRKFALQGRLVTRFPGYVLHVEPGELDVERFGRELSDGRAALAEGDATRAAEFLRGALALFRGEPLSDFRYEPFAQAEIARLEELRLACLEERIEADLRLNREGDLIAELETLVTEHPLRERLRGQLMLALYRAGRQAEALELYRETRRTLREELGLEPGPALRALEQAILRQDTSLAPASGATPPTVRPAAEPPSSVREERKTVTVLFAGLADSTGLAERLDAEALRKVLARYFESGAEAIRRHGGSVEKLVGDALMAVFGVPKLHEDDALRALRAASDLREQVAALDVGLARDLGVRLEVRIGVNTGEVVVDAGAADQALVTGEPVIAAARLEQAAPPGEIVLGEATRRLVSSAVEVEPLPSLRLKGMKEAPTAWRLLKLVPGAPPFPRLLDAALVGREVELAQLRTAFERAARERSLQLVTLLGPAGIGKTRLGQELAAILASEAQVLQGRCLPYGEGITFWPLRELLLQVTGEAVPGGLRELLATEKDAEWVADRLLGAIGLSTAGAETDQIFAASRRLLETLAREQPLLVILEDLHWAEPTFLDLVEHLADFSSDAPILLLSLARSELLEKRSAWAGGKRNATSLDLAPLTDDESGQLLDNLAGKSALLIQARDKVKEAAEGNPLFLEQLIAMIVEGRYAQGELPLPPTIQALLAARLDQLGPGERAVLERVAIVGKESQQRAVVELLPEEARPSAVVHLQELVRRQFLRPSGSAVTGEHVFRFRHILIQQAAYRSIPKALRAELHERFAIWLEDLAGERAVEYDEILGYHLEQAYRFLADLGQVDGRAQDLAGRAAQRLTASGRRAFARGDMPAATNLLERASALLPSDDRRRLSLLPSLGRALIEQGQLERAEAVLSEAIESGRAAGERGVAADAAVALSFVHLHTDPQSTHTNVRLELENAIRVFEELHDEGGLARALGLAGVLRLWDGQAATAIEELERAARHAQVAGDRAQEVESLRFLVVAVRVGPIPVASALERIEAIGGRVRGHRRLEVTILQARAHLEAMGGNFDAARELIAEAQSSAHELGLEMDLAARVLRSAGEIELLAGDPAAAEQALRPAYEALERLGAWTHLASVAPGFADALYAQGRGAEAFPSIELAARWTVSEDVEAQIGLRRVRAKLLAQQGDLAAAERLARDATELAARTDHLDHHAQALADLAEVLRSADLPKEATGALEEAIRLYEQKGNVVAARTLRALLAEPAIEV